MRHAGLKLRLKRVEHLACPLHEAGEISRMPNAMIRHARKEYPRIEFYVAKVSQLRGVGENMTSKRSKEFWRLLVAYTGIVSLSQTDNKVDELTASQSRWLFQLLLVRRQSIQ